MAKAKRSDKELVDEFWQALDHPLKEQIARLRTIVLGADPRIKERIKWNSLSYYDVADFLTFGPMKPPKAGDERVLLVFHHPHIVKVKSALLEGTFPDRRLVYIDGKAGIKQHQQELVRIIVEVLAAMQG